MYQDWCKVSRIIRGTNPHAYSSTHAYACMRLISHFKRQQEASYWLILLMPAATSPRDPQCSKLLSCSKKSR